MNIYNTRLSLMVVFILCGCATNQSVMQDAKESLEGKGIEVSKYELYKYQNANNKEIVKLLHEAGVEPLKKNEELLYASYEGHADVVNCLIKEGTNVNNDVFTTSNPLIAASISGQLDIIKILQANGAIINDADYRYKPFSTTALLEAVNANHFDCVKFLLEKGANPNLCKYSSIDPRDAIGLAIKNENNNMVKLLVKYGSRLPCDDCGLDLESMLAPAIIGDQDELGKCLLIIDESYPKISINEYYKHKALNLAIKYGNKRMVHFLLAEKKIKPTKQSIEIAKRYKQMDIRKLLEQYADRSTLTSKREHGKK